MKAMQASFNEQRLTWILDLLIREGRLHRGQKSDVLNRGSEQARHILLDKRAELRKLLGKQRVTYFVSEIELIASFRFEDQGDSKRGTPHRATHHPRGGR